MVVKPPEGIEPSAYCFLDFSDGFLRMGWKIYHAVALPMSYGGGLHYCFGKTSFITIVSSLPAPTLTMAISAPTCFAILRI